MMMHCVILFKVSSRVYLLLITENRIHRLNYRYNLFICRHLKPHGDVLIYWTIYVILVILSVCCDSAHKQSRITRTRHEMTSLKDDPNEYISELCLTKLHTGHRHSHHSNTYIRTLLFKSFWMVYSVLCVPCLLNYYCSTGNPFASSRYGCITLHKYTHM